MEALACGLSVKLSPTALSKSAMASGTKKGNPFRRGAEGDAHAAQDRRRRGWLSVKRLAGSPQGQAE